MLVSEAITLLRSSELKQLGLKTQVSDILGYINFGILEIYKRFNLWEAEAVITQVDAVDTYKLDGIDANVTIDLSDHNLLMIDRIYDSEDLLYIINNEKDPLSIFTTKFHEIKVATIVPGDVMTVKYRASPLFLTTDNTEIPLPVQFLEALFMFVGYKGQNSIRSGVKDDSNASYMRFDAACERIKTEGLYLQKDLESNKFESRGFV